MLLKFTIEHDPDTGQTRMNVPDPHLGLALFLQAALRLHEATRPQEEPSRIVRATAIPKVEGKR